jgi:enoyl-CoA hydratase/carnithine racemase
MFIRKDQGAVAVLQFAHGKVSALDADLCDALVREIDSIEASAATALVLTGTGTSFSAGVDLFAFLNGGDEYARRFLPAMNAFFRRLLTFVKPLVAAVNGHAIAGGCVIAAACDHRVMADGTGRIGVPELVVGVPFPMLPFEIVRARLTPQVFRDLVFSGRVVLPREAVALALVDEVVEASSLVDSAARHAERLTRIPAATFALTKRALAGAILERAERAVSHDRDVAAAWSSAEVHAAIRAYLDRTIKKAP